MNYFLFEQLVLTDPENAPLIPGDGTTELVEKLILGKLSQTAEDEKNHAALCVYMNRLPNKQAVFLAVHATRTNATILMTGPGKNGALFNPVAQKLNKMDIPLRIYANAEKLNRTDRDQIPAELIPDLDRSLMINEEVRKLLRDPDIDPMQFLLEAIIEKVRAVETFAEAVQLMRLCVSMDDLYHVVVEQLFSQEKLSMEDLSRIEKNIRAERLLIR